MATQLIEAAIRAGKTANAATDKIQYFCASIVGKKLSKNEWMNAYLAAEEVVNLHKEAAKKFKKLSHPDVEWHLEKAGEYREEAQWIAGFIN